MERFVARANIRGYRERLEQITDAAAEVMLRRMIADEERKLELAEAKHKAQLSACSGRPPASEADSQKPEQGKQRTFRHDRCVSREEPS